MVTRMPVKLGSTSGADFCEQGSAIQEYTVVLGSTELDTQIFVQTIFLHLFPEYHANF